VSDIHTGNFSHETSDHKGWVIGNFIDQTSPFSIPDFEIKWGVYKKGDRKINPGLNQLAKSLTILIRGKFQIEFPELNQKFILQTEGDYIYWPPSISHTWEALEDFLTLTIRWPSLPNDQIPV
jgi:hypothetical protein